MRCRWFKGLLIGQSIEDDEDDETIGGRWVLSTSSKGILRYSFSLPQGFSGDLKDYQFLMVMHLDPLV